MKLQNNRKSIAIDMDGVIADIEPHLLAGYERECGIKLSLADIQGLSGEEAFPEKGVIAKVLHSPGFFRKLDVMPGAISGVKQLMEKYEVYIVSAATEFPLSLYEKYEWLKEHFPFISWRNIVLCGDKSIINTHYMIDDHCKNLDFCSGKTIMFNAHHNVHLNHHFRVHNWEEVLNFFESESQ